MKIINSLLFMSLFLFLGTGCENIFSDSGNNLKKNLEKLLSSSFAFSKSDKSGSGGTYSFKCIDGEKNYAYKSVNYGDFTLQVDFKMEECTWSGGIAFGLWGDNGASGNRVHLDVSNTDEGKCFILSVEGGGYQKVVYNYAIGTWYTAVLNYDWSEERLSCNIKDRSTDTSVANLEVADASIPRGASGILIGNPGGDGIGTASCEIDNLIFIENGQVVVQEDFSHDPDWTVTDPSDLYRITSSETFHLTCVESEGEYVFKDIHYGDFSIQFEVKIDECTWSGGMIFGFWDANLTTHGDVLFTFSNTDGGKCFILSVGDGGYQKVFYDYTFGAWYRCNLTYNWDDKSTTVVVKERTTDAIIANLQVAGYAVPDKISRLILGDPGGDGIGMVSGEVDNVIITEDGQTIYSEDFSKDPGWTATDDADLYWKK